MGSKATPAQSGRTQLEDLATEPTGAGNAKGKRASDKLPNRVWIAVEEQALNEVLKMAKASGLKSKNGWKPNYKNFLWKEIHKLLPGTDIQVSPHIMSKIKQWTREYACISALKDKSGCGWDSIEKRFTGLSQEMWNSHIQAYSGMSRKKDYMWPFYDDWEYVFGKDRANRNGAMDVREAAKRFIPDIINKANKKAIGQEDFGSNADGWYDGDDGASSANNAKKAKTTTTKPSSSADDGFVDAIKEILTKSKEETTNILRAKVNDALKPLGLSERDRLMLGRKLSKDESMLHFFFSLDDVERASFARLELDDIGYRPTF